MARKDDNAVLERAVWGSVTPAWECLVLYSWDKPRAGQTLSWYESQLERWELMADA